ncbi:hypothetical protein NRK68_36640 (plasmid) [Streptomyces yangpuensis]|uniref:Uncharacterized protein n=1 Tax=Streptomyces yangpuensis TaxID=1648182 RepID=A0ABY5Q8K5_9ACTN|nr:hypothetical protein [Streptomyces yangpuensis]UUY52786.1 hypothetical protein NRK68_36640 [Streptomyces yangpuensis]
MSDLHFLQASCTPGCHRLALVPASLTVTVLTRTAAGAGLLSAGGAR